MQLVLKNNSCCYFKEKKKNYGKGKYAKERAADITNGSNT